MTGNTVNIRANGALEIPNIVQNKLVQAKSGATTRPFSTLQATSRSPARETTISSIDPIKKIIKIIWAIKKSFNLWLSSVQIDNFPSRLAFIGTRFNVGHDYGCFLCMLYFKPEDLLVFIYNENNFLLTPEFFSSYISCMTMMCMYHVCGQ